MVMFEGLYFYYDCTKVIIYLGNNNIIYYAIMKNSRNFALRINCLVEKFGCLQPLKKNAKTAHTFPKCFYGFS